MDISNFFTLPIATPGSQNIPAQGNGAQNTDLPQINFLDFILAQITEETKKTAGASIASTEELELLSSGNPVLDSEINIAELVAANPEIREEIENWLLDLDSKLSHTLALNQESMDTALMPLTGGIITSANIEAGSPRILQALLVDTNVEGSGSQTDSPGLLKLKAILGKLETLINNPENGELALTNLTPGEITDLKTKIDVLLNENAEATISEDERKKAINGIYLGLINLLAPDEQPPVPTLAQVQTAIDVKTGKTDNSLNPLTHNTKISTSTGLTSETPLDNGTEDGAQNGARSNNEFASLLKDFSGKKNNFQSSPQGPATTPSVKPDLSTLQGWPFNMEGSISTPPGWSNVPYDEFSAQSSGLSVNNLGTLTNLVTQAHSASQQHQATQIVAASIARATANGETRNIILQLDPPELGRVEIKLHFGKDKDVKAVLTAEKPETLAMLQRDSHSLERALLNSGLDADGSSLSFQLAQDGYDFNGQGRDSGSGSYASGNGGDEDILDSTMTWHVDPETGHMRYNILV